jgi:hypothetical protein
MTAFIICGSFYGSRGIGNDSRRLATGSRASGGDFDTAAVDVTIPELVLTLAYNMTHHVVIGIVHQAIALKTTGYRILGGAITMILRFDEAWQRRYEASEVAAYQKHGAWLCNGMSNGDMRC